MGQLTVIKPDSKININGIPVQECDMSGLPDDLHALQWNGTSGHVEYVSVTKPNLSINSEAELESALGVSKATIIARHETALEASKPAG